MSPADGESTPLDPAPGEAPPAAFSSYLEVEVGGERFAIPLRSLLSVHRVDHEPPAVPRAPREIRGALLVREEVVGLVDLARLAGRPGAGVSPPFFAAIVGEGEDHFGLCVDDGGRLAEVADDAWVAPAAVAPPLAAAIDGARLEDAGTVHRLDVAALVRLLAVRPAAGGPA